MYRIASLLWLPSMALFSSAALASERFYIGMGYQLEQPAGQCTSQHSRAEMILDLQTQGVGIDAGAIALSKDGENPLALACEQTTGPIVSGALGNAPSSEICLFQSAALPSDFVRSIETSRESDGHTWPKRWRFSDDFTALFFLHYSWKPARLAFWPSCPLNGRPISVIATPQLVEFGPVDRFGRTWIRESNEITLHGQLESSGEFTARGKLWLRRVDDEY